MRKRLVGSLIISLMILAMGTLGNSALAATGGNPASGWHIGYYTPSVIGTLSTAQAPTGDGVASLNFTNLANTATLTTSQRSQNSGLLGDLTGTAVSASVTVSNVSGGATFIYGGEPSCGGTTPYVRYFFTTSNAGGFDETHYWWSNPVDLNLVANTSASLASVSFGGANWSDFFGHFGNDPAYAAGFAAAVGNVTQIGLSFGGGCFFENGVGTSDGSGTFTINTFTVS